MAVVVIAGILGVVALVAGVRSVGRSAQQSARQGVQTVQPPAPGDHWHVAYGVNVCGSWQPPFTDRGEDEYGIHTHGDGVIHVHPFTSEAAGTSATFGVFANQVGMVLADDTVRLPDGTSRTDGDDCDGQPASWRLVEWNVDDPRATPVERFGGFAAATYGGDRHAMTLAFLPDGAEVPKPPTIPVLDQLTDAPTTTLRRPGTTTSPRPTGPPIPGAPAVAENLKGRTITEVPAGFIPTTEGKGEGALTSLTEFGQVPWLATEAPTTMAGGYSTRWEHADGRSLRVTLVQMPSAAEASSYHGDKVLAAINLRMDRDTKVVHAINDQALAWSIETMVNGVPDGKVAHRVSFAMGDVVALVGVTGRPDQVDAEQAISIATAQADRLR